MQQNSYTRTIGNVTLKLNKKLNEYDEYVIRYYVNGKYDEDKSNYTDDWDDAVGTFHEMVKEAILRLALDSAVL